jgi:DNA-binding transcriptional LysR family regulator
MQTIRLFCDVARYHSFSKAAAEHKITQSAASQRISALEKRLGVTLLDRSVRPLALTAAGELFLNEGLGLIERYERLEHRVSQLGVGPSGHVHVQSIYSAGIDLLNQVHDQFEHKYPRVQIDIQYARPDEVYDSVRDERCDLGILSYPQRWRDVGVIPLRDEVMAVICRPGHELARRKQVHASELDRYLMAGFEADLPVARSIKRFLREHGSAPRVTSAFDNIDTIKNAVAVTDCFSILPRRTVEREVVAGQLVALMLEPRLIRPLGVIYHRRNGSARQFTPAVQSFVDFLVDQAGADSHVQDKPQRREACPAGETR